MKHPRLKLLSGIVVLLLLTAALAAAFFSYGVRAGVEEAIQEGKVQNESVSAIFRRLSQTDARAYDNYYYESGTGAELLTACMRDIIRREGDGAVRMYGSGGLVRVDGDRLLQPADAPEPIPEETVEAFISAGENRDEGGYYHSYEVDGNYVVRQYDFDRVLDEYYYVNYLSYFDIVEYLQSQGSLPDIMRNMQQAFGSCILIFDEYEGKQNLLFSSDERFKGYETAEAMGIDLDGPQIVRIDGVRYCLAVSDPITYDYGDSNRCACLIPYDDIVRRQISKTCIMLAFAIIFFVASLVWVTSAAALIRRKVVSKSHRTLYGPSRMRRLALTIGIIELIAVMLLSMFTDALLDLYAANAHSLESLSLVEDLLAEMAENDIVAQRAKLYANHAQVAADILEAYPELQTQPVLQEMCEIIEAESLTLYNRQGVEMLSSGPYVNLTFGSSEASSTYDFRRLLLGVPSIFHPACTDEQTGLEREQIGVSLRDGEGGYLALVLSMEPLPKDSIPTAGDWIDALTSANNLCFGLDKESATIRCSSVPQFVGGNALDLGLAESSLRDGFMDFFHFNNQNWYGCAREIDGSLYFYATRLTALWQNLLRNSAVIGGCFLAAYALFALFLLFDYTDRSVALNDSQERSDVGPDREPNTGASETVPGKSIVVQHALRNWWQEKLPGQRALFSAHLLLGILLALLAIVQFGMPGMSRYYSIFSYVMNGQWQPGVNLFAITKIALISASLMLAMLAISMLLGLIGTMLEKRGKTLCRLLESLIRYIATLTVLYQAFVILGIDTTVLLGSVGFISLAVSLGSKDLVSDVLSGISIAFAGEYQIGDFVEIAGFRGWVQDIGVRSTTLVNSEGHIKSMSNRDVKNVLNLSRRNCRYSINITIGYEQPLGEVEALLRTELPKIGEQIEEIIYGPEYRGLTTLGSGGMTLSIVAECKEKNYGLVRRRLNREIQRLLEENDIKIK